MKTKLFIALLTVGFSFPVLARDVITLQNREENKSEGLFRMIENGKIGFADLNGNIIIKPQYDCAFPFEQGLAKVSKDCRSIKNGEHTAWISDNWYFIDKKGKSVVE